MTFALITEGISEHNIIRHILQKYFKEYDPDINQIQPKITTGKQEGTGGWNEVLKYCERTEELKTIFGYNDYLVIQIDSDQSQDKSFAVSHTKEDSEVKTAEQLHADIVSGLQERIAAEVLEIYGDKILFAICIHTIECWLLPVFYTDKQKAATANCLFKLNSELGKKKIHIIPPTAKNGPNSIRTYIDILNNWKRKQDIIAASRHNAGFSWFVTMLESVAVVP